MGRMAEDLDDATWALIDSAGPARPAQEEIGAKTSATSAGLAMLLKMTRLHDLGLAQLCMPELVIQEDAHTTETRQDRGKFEMEGVHIRESSTL